MKDCDYTTISISKTDRNTLRIEGARLGLFSGVRPGTGMVVHRVCETLRRLHKELGLVHPDVEEPPK